MIKQRDRRRFAIYYFDHCATTPPYEEVVEAYAEVLRRYYGNPSSIHRLGVEAEGLVDRSREVLASIFEVKPEEIIFTSGGTESNNLAIKGAAHQYRNRGNHIITTSIEHPSVYECCRQLEKDGFRVTYVMPDRTGHIRIDDIEAALTEDTILVSVMHVNNEVGSIQPIAQIGQLLRSRPRTLFHVDGVQSIGKINVKLKSWGIDLFTGSAHKLRGPKGVGFLYSRNGIRLTPLLAGGGQEQDYRSGTLHVPGIVAMAKAVRMTMERQKQQSASLYDLRQYLLQQIGQIPELHVNGSVDRSNMAPHIVNFSYPGMKPEVVLHSLEDYGIYVSTQSACSSKLNKPSRVLQAMNAGEAAASSSIRISLSADHSKEDIDWLVSSIQKVVHKLKPLERS